MVGVVTVSIVSDRLRFSSFPSVSVSASVEDRSSASSATSMASDTFDELGAFLSRSLFRGMRRHGDKGKKWVADRYWHPKGKREWEFYTEDEALLRHIDVKKKRYVIGNE